MTDEAKFFNIVNQHSTVIVGSGEEVVATTATLRWSSSKPGKHVVIWLQKTEEDVEIFAEAFGIKNLDGGHSGHRVSPKIRLSEAPSPIIVGVGDGSAECLISLTMKPSPHRDEGECSISATVALEDGRPFTPIRFATKRQSVTKEFAHGSGRS